MIKALSYVALVVAIGAGSALLYRNQPYSIRFEHERAGEVKKDVEKVVVPAPTPTPFGPVPNVVVQSVPAPVTAPAPVVAPTPALTPKPAKKKPKPKPKGAVHKLKSKWVQPGAQATPVEEPFSLEKLFNVR